MRPTIERYLPPVAGATFGSCSPTGAQYRPEPDRINHSTIMLWDSFLGRSARPTCSQVYGGANHGYGTPPTHPSENVHCYGGSTVPGYGVILVSP
jgi:hypothetical protein